MQSNKIDMSITTTVKTGFFYVIGEVSAKLLCINIKIAKIYT